MTLEEKIDALIAATTAVQEQQASILTSLEDIKNPATPASGFTQEEVDAVLAANDEYREKVKALLTPTP